SSGSEANPHSPSRSIHASRVSCGRGWRRSEVTWLVLSVERGAGEDVRRGVAQREPDGGPAGNGLGGRLESPGRGPALPVDDRHLEPEVGLGHGAGHLDTDADRPCRLTGPDPHDAVGLVDVGPRPWDAVGVVVPGPVPPTAGPRRLAVPEDQA